MNLLLLSNFVALASSSIALIPIGVTLESAFPTGIAWALLFSVLRLPGIFLAPLYVNHANANGPEKTVERILTIAILAFALLTGFIWTGSHAIYILMSYAIFRALLTGFDFLLPGMIASRAEVAKRAFGNWQFVIAFSGICTITIGGILNDHLPVYLIALVCLTMILGALICFKVSVSHFELERVASLSKRPISLSARNFNWRQVTASSILRLVVFRSVCFGILNPIIPVFIIDDHGYSKSILGWVFFVLGASAMLGAVLSKVLAIGHRLFVCLVILELGCLILALITTSTAVFVLALSISAVTNSILDVHLLADFMGKYKDRRNAAGSIFKALDNVALVVGYLVGGIWLLHSTVLVSATVFLLLGVGALLSIKSDESHLDVSA